MFQFVSSNPMLYYIFLKRLPGGAQDETYLVVEILHDGRTLNKIEEVETSRAIFEVYEGGVVCCVLPQSPGVF